jgi:Rrf2 family transcriptional regulator, iron-sulfur cluster assembly transcription factor
MTELLSTRALLAIQTVAYIAYHGQDGQPIKSNRIIERYRLNKRALEPILQQLSRARIVESKQGANGGYMLSDPAKVTLADVAAVFIDDFCADSLCFSDWRALLLPTLQSTQRHSLDGLRKITFAKLVREATKAGVSRDEDAPLDFII